MNFRHLSISYVPLVCVSVPDEWYVERNKNPHLIMMYVWLLFGFLISQSYKTNFLANLVRVEYEKSPETFQVLFLLFNFCARQYLFSIRIFWMKNWEFI